MCAALLSAATQPQGAALDVSGSGSFCLAMAAAARRASVDLRVWLPPSVGHEHRMLLRQHQFAVAACTDTVLKEEDRHWVFRPADAALLARASEAFRDTLGRELVEQLQALHPAGVDVYVPQDGSGLAEGLGAAAAAAPFSMKVFSVGRKGDAEMDGVLPLGAGVSEAREVTLEEAQVERLRYARENGVLMGLGGACASVVAQRGDSSRARVVIATDAGDRYFSVGGDLES